MGKKDITNRNDQMKIIKSLVDIFNEMLNDLQIDFNNFHYINLRDMFPKDEQWHNEIHLKNKGYDIVAEKYHLKIKSILGYDPLSN